MAESPPKARKPIVVEHRDRWIRLMYMVIFAIIGYSLFWLILFLAAVQFLLTWIHGEPNENLRDFAARLDAYFQGVLDFIGYASDVVPFPFSPLATSVAGTGSTQGRRRRSRARGGAKAAPAGKADSPAGGDRSPGPPDG